MVLIYPFSQFEQSFKKEKGNQFNTELFVVKSLGPSVPLIKF